MPYRWTKPRENHERLELWPYRSLPRSGFVWFIGLTSGALALPLIGVLGTPVWWGILPFMAIVLAGVWYALSLTYRSGSTREVLELTPREISVTRTEPGKASQSWSANPYWIRAELRPGPVEHYLVLTGDHKSGREIELGAFLTPEERSDLRRELAGKLAALRDVGEG